MKKGGKGVCIRGFVGERTSLISLHLNVWSGSLVLPSSMFSKSEMRCGGGDNHRLYNDRRRIRHIYIHKAIQTKVRHTTCW